MIPRISALAVESQIHSLPKKYGIAKIIASWNTNILKNDIHAETSQLFNHVKNADQKIFIHWTIYHIAYNLIALVVKANSSGS
jgi:GDP-D-mannose dehydratase